MCNYTIAGHNLCAPFDINFDFNLRRDHQKKFYEHSDYQSVDKKSLS